MDEYVDCDLDLNGEGFTEINDEKWGQLQNRKKELLADENISIMIKANCLLRKGKIRYFRLNGILNIKRVKSFDRSITTDEDVEQTTHHSLFEEKYDNYK